MSHEIKRRLEAELGTVRLGPKARARIVAALRRETAPAVRRMPLVAVTALACVLLAGAALGACVTGSVDWWGRPVQEELAPEPTPQDAEEPAGADVLGEGERLMAQQPEGEVWIIGEPGEDGSRIVQQPTERLGSLEALRQRLERSDSPLKLPAQLPDGYRIDQVAASYYLSEPLFRQKQPFERWVLESGLTVHKYRIDPEERDCVLGYYLLLTGSRGERLTINAVLSDSTAEHSFGIAEGAQYRAVSVTGMDNALLVSSAGSMKLYLRKTGLTPLEVWNYLDLYGEHPQGYWCDAVEYDLRGDALTDRQLMQIGASLT